MKKIKLITVFAFLAVGFAQAQSLSSSVIGSTGEQFKSASGSLEWTLGEIMTETYKQSNGYLTQGFQQPATIKVTSIDAVEENNLVVYPNPTLNFLNVQTTENGDYRIELFDMQGQKLININSTTQNGPHIHQLDLQDFRAAVYLLRISNTSTGKNASLKIEKL